MKNLFLICILCTSIVSLNAQERYGAAIFTTPAGWSKNETAKSVTLEMKSTKNEICKIIISTTQKMSTLTEGVYTNSRSKFSTGNFTYPGKKNAVTKYEGDGLTAFFSIGNAAQQNLNSKSYFYSLSDGKQSFFVQLITTSNDCISLFNEFIQSLHMELSEEPNQKNKAAAKARKPSAAFPIASAPMM